MRNSMTAPYMWLLCSLSVVPAILFWENETLLEFSVFGFALIYILLYQSLARFRAPRFLVRKRPPLLMRRVRAARK